MHDISGVGHPAIFLDSDMPTEYWYLFVFAFGAVCAWAVIKGLE